MNTEPFSSRYARLPSANRLAIVSGEMNAAGRSILDLTLSNPTRIGLAYPNERIGEALRRGAMTTYDPAALGTPSARTAIAGSLDCSARDVAITASTSEAYSFLFKLFGDPGDTFMTTRPAYPLLDHLARAEKCSLIHAPLELEPGVGWSLDVREVERRLEATTRALIVVHPNNPTGSYLKVEEARDLGDLCARHNLVLISDEVFYDYPLDSTSSRALSLASMHLPCLTISLGGLSKSAGMPQLKLGWMRFGGPDARRIEAIRRLELISDSFLSVATPVQAALPELLSIGDDIHQQIQERIHTNLEGLRSAIATHSSIESLPVEGGWSGVVRVPRLMSDEELAIRFLRDHETLVHPGFLYDFEGEGFVVVSLLPETGTFVGAIGRLAGFVGELVG